MLNMLTLIAAGIMVAAQAMIPFVIFFLCVLVVIAAALLVAILRMLGMELLDSFNSWRHNRR